MYQIPKDVYVEARFKRRGGWRVVLFRILLVILLSILFAICLFLTAGNSWAFLVWAVLAFAFVYAWKFQKKLDIEYEYIFTNGDLDVDKIIAREDRKRRYSLNVKDMEFIEPYTNPEKYTNMKFDRIAFPCSSPKDDGLYCFAFRDHSYGRCLIVVNMTDELLEAIENARPKQYGNVPQTPRMPVTQA